MLKSIRNYAGRGVSVVTAALVFVFTLPIVLIASLIMMIAGMIALANLRYRLRQAVDEMPNQARPDSDVQNNRQNKRQSGRHRPPIEGSYTVVKD